VFPALPTIAGYCVRVRVKLGSGASGGRDKLPATGRIHARQFTLPALRWQSPYSYYVESREFEALTSAMQRRYRCCCLAPLTITESHKEPILTIHSSLRNRLLVFIVLILA
jgi:hypothetical protein